MKGLGIGLGRSGSAMGDVYVYQQRAHDVHPDKCRRRFETDCYVPALALQADVLLY